MSSKVQNLKCGECHSDIAADDNFCQECGAAQQSKSRWVTLQLNTEPVASVETKPAQEMNPIVETNSPAETKQTDLTAGDFLKREAEQLKIAQLASEPIVNHPKLDLPKRDTTSFGNGQEVAGNKVVPSEMNNENKNPTSNESEVAYRSSHHLRSPLLQALEEREESPIEFSKNFRIAAVAIIVVLFVAACSLFVLSNFKSINSALTKPQQYSNQQANKPVAKLSKGTDDDSDLGDKSDDPLAQIEEATEQAQPMPQAETKQAKEPQVAQTPKTVSQLVPKPEVTRKVISEAPNSSPAPAIEKKAIQTAALPSKKSERKERFVTSPLMTAETPPHLVSTTDGAARSVASKPEFNEKDKDVADYNKMLANFFSNPDNLASKEPPTLSDWVKGGKQEF